MRVVAPLLCLLSALAVRAEPVTLRLWHSYRGAEEAALVESVRSLEAADPTVRLELLANPYDNFASKLTTAIPNGHGPDLFIYAHERVGGWAHTVVVRALDDLVTEDVWTGLLPETVAPLTFEGRRWGLPLAFKSLALFFNRDLMPDAPRTTDELVAAARGLTRDGRFGLAYQADNFFFHAPWFFGFGGELLKHDQSGLASPGAVQALGFVDGLARSGLLPAEPTGALVTRLFNDGRAAMVVNGPWFAGEIAPTLHVGVAPLPVVSATGLPARPFLTVEGLFVSGRSEHAVEAARVAAALVGTGSALVRAVTGRQVVATRGAWDDPRLASDELLQALKAGLPNTVPMSNAPDMRNVWEPANLALKKVLRGESTPEQAARAAERRFLAIRVSDPPAVGAGPYLIVAVIILMILAVIMMRWIVFLMRSGGFGPMLQGARWAGPGMLATVVLVFVPFVGGLVLSFFSHHEGRFTFVGLANYVDILLSRRFAPSEPLSFGFALGVTLLWTVVNLALHVSTGLGLALLLNRPALRMKAAYRVLLILPWSVPNYITALLWKGLFHRQFGAINGLLKLCGLDGVAWFSSFGTAFFANVCTNAWLGFPFMMVVCLGALQAVPKELLEAADIDGAGPWARFRHVTWPLLQPALVPAVLLGTVWTFNAFNVIYLVSGGEPDNATDILVSEAYRWAFTRQEQYGYAAAYAALIFVLLTAWSAVSRRIAARVEDAR